MLQLMVDNTGPVLPSTQPTRPIGTARPGRSTGEQRYHDEPPLSRQKGAHIARREGHDSLASAEEINHMSRIVVDELSFWFRNGLRRGIPFGLCLPNSKSRVRNRNWLRRAEYLTWSGVYYRT
jgi:hypothetical protein